MDRTVDSIRPHYEFNESCQETVPEALICALEATSFEDAIRNAISIGGDSDTVAAIAGPVAEARFGIPDEIARAAMEMIPDDMQETLRKLYARSEYAHPIPGDRPVIAGGAVEAAVRGAASHRGIARRAYLSHPVGRGVGVVSLLRARCFSLVPAATRGG